MTGKAFPALAGIGIGLALVVGSFGAIYQSTRNDRLAQYQAAPACAGLTDALAGRDCRYTGTATVRDVQGDPSGTSVDIGFSGPYGPSFQATLPTNSTAASLLKPGDQVQVEIWRSRTTRLGGANTADNPANDPRQGNLLVIGLMLLPIGVGATAWSLLAMRRLRRGESEAGGPRMGPVAVSDALWH